MGEVIRVNFTAKVNGVLREHVRDILKGGVCDASDEAVDEVIAATDGLNLMILNAARKRMSEERMK